MGIKKNWKGRTKSRQKVAAEVNSTLIMTYWQIGKIIVEDEQKHESHAGYGKQTLKTLSKVLSEEYGKGFSRSNLQNMRRFISPIQNDSQ